ncbi:NADPH-dependent FMN reductase [Nonomuraea sp. SBT364]|uniref:NADPH-dependent FMN reductase n=1 Tax=Nonomuraea sp. SBT364 TaxID=1580530 RepID=UPI00069E7969|nr:NAD(P)H-dependent oxidoreductase [Nonomuraea sp. SBT364]
MVLIGDVRAANAGDWLADRACRRCDVEIDLIDLAAACLPDVRPDVRPEVVPTPPAVRDLAPWLASGDGFVVVVPERSPGSLSNVIAWYGREWRGKPVAFAGGGCDRLVRRLRPVFADAHTVTVPGVARVPADVDRMLDQLVWWARPLRETRVTTPYPL